MLHNAFIFHASRRFFILRTSLAAIMKPMQSLRVYNRDVNRVCVCTTADYRGYFYYCDSKAAIFVYLLQ